MRIISFLLITSLLASLCGCSSEQPPYEPEKKTVTIWEGETSHVIIDTDLTQYNYRLESKNQEIATATLDDMGIYIITIKSGSTTIRLIDTVNNKTVCEIYVYVKYFNSLEINDWGIPLKEGSPGYPGIIVKTTDFNIQKEIENELWERCIPYVGAIYTFNHKTRIFKMKTLSGISHEGTYEWNLTSLTLMYDGKKEKYGFSFATGMIHGYIIQADKTEEYQQRYPHADITEVKVKHVWKDNGINHVGGLIF